MTRTFIVCLIALLSVLPKFGEAQEHKYLYTRYIAAGGPATLKDIDSWRITEKETLRARIIEFSPPIKQDLIDSTDRSLQQPWPQILLADYREFQENGNRVNFERLYLNRRTKKLNIQFRMLAFYFN